MNVVVNTYTLYMKLSIIYNVFIQLQINITPFEIYYVALKFLNFKSFNAKLFDFQLYECQKDALPPLGFELRSFYCR